MNYRKAVVAMSSSAAAQHGGTGAGAKTAAVPRAILGGVAGDVAGSIYENDPIKSSSFSPFLDPACHFTDDTVLTVATMQALLTDRDYASAYRRYGRMYPNAGYGASFIDWFSKDDAGPYSSWGNGSAMRVSPIGWAFNTRDEVLAEAKLSAEVTHDHPEGIKGAQATALAIYLARSNETKESIVAEIESEFDYDLSSGTVDDIRPSYKFDVSCQGSVPESMLCFLESDSVEEAIRLAISLGGDSDTQACIAGSIAEAYYGSLGGDLASEVRKYLPTELLSVVDAFGQKYL